MAPVDISSDATKLKAKSGKENICILLDFEFSRYGPTVAQAKRAGISKKYSFLTRS